MKISDILPDAPCLLVFGGERPSWVRYGELRAGWAAKPHSLGIPGNMRGVYDSLEDALAAAIVLGHSPSQWASYSGTRTQPRGILADMSVEDAHERVKAAKARRRAELARIFPGISA